MFSKARNIILNNTSLFRWNNMHKYESNILGNADIVCVHWVMKCLKSIWKLTDTVKMMCHDLPKEQPACFLPLLFISQRGKSYRDRLRIPTH